MTTGAATGAATGDSGVGIGEVEAEIADSGAGIGESGEETVKLGVEIGESGAETAETADSVVEIGKVEAGIEDFVAAVGYQEIQFALGIDSPAGPDAMVKPWGVKLEVPSRTSRLPLILRPSCTPKRDRDHVYS